MGYGETESKFAYALQTEERIYVCVRVCVSEHRTVCGDRERERDVCLSLSLTFPSHLQECFSAPPPSCPHRSSPTACVLPSRSPIFSLGSTMARSHGGEGCQREREREREEWISEPPTGRSETQREREREREFVGQPVRNGEERNSES